MKQLLKIIDKDNGSCSVKSPELKPINAKLHQPATNFRGRAAVVTLGCAKNHVDSEVMLGVLDKHGFEIVSEVENADVAIVNTCGFLESSVKESIDCVLEVARLKKEGRLRKLIVAGCMVERYKGDIRQTLPEVDAFIGVNDLLDVAKVAANEDESIEQILQESARPYFLYDESTPRQHASLPHYAYVKVSEGCDRPCTFCIIPKIRGSMRSRTINSIVSEINNLGRNGVKEVNLVAQDLTSFGKDRSSSELTQLLRAIDASKAVDWVRLLYAYPIGVDEDLLRSIVELPSICNYLDMPLQHSSENVLKMMKRPIGRYAAKPIIEFIKKTTPEILLRTTFIVGFPGETEEDIKHLESFVSEGYFSSVGVFTYSREEGTPSYDMLNQVSEEEKQDRRERIMLAQQRVVEKNMADYLNKEIPVLIEGLHPESDDLIVARSYFQAPEVDGNVIINDIQHANQELNLEREVFGKILTAKITEVSGYDLIGSINLTITQ
jgi:ribosomal protein S12 methylthiotransferase